MPRTLRQLDPGEREAVVSAIHQEAEQAGWSRLTPQQKGAYYRKWGVTFDLSHPTMKDRILKGFDVAQGHAKTGEALIQEQLLLMFREQGMYVRPQFAVWTGAERIDMLLGYSDRFPTHAVEVERADSWIEGFRQALWYRAAIWQQQQKQVAPTLVLFGDASADRFERITITCNDNRVTLWSYQLTVAGVPEEAHSVFQYLHPQLLLQMPAIEPGALRTQMALIPGSETMDPKMESA